MRYKQLTQENASKLVEKKVDVYKKGVGIYPKKVIEINGEYFCECGDTSVCIRIPDEKDKFNAIYYDFVREE